MRTCFAQERIALVFFIDENTADGSGSPLVFAAVSGQARDNAVNRDIKFAGQERSLKNVGVIRHGNALIKYVLIIDRVYGE